MDAASESEEPVCGEVVSVAHALSLPAESYGNDPDIEMAWAIRAMQHAEVYYKLISSVDPQFLKLTKVDDQIYSEFRENFETLRVDVLDPEELKSESAKEKWRPFCLKFEGIVEDYNYGTLLRLDCSQGYTEENTIFGNKKRENQTALKQEASPKEQTTLLLRRKAAKLRFGFHCLKSTGILSPIFRVPAFTSASNDGLYQFLTSLYANLSPFFKTLSRHRQ
ncbi:protein PBDC1 isoform X3 [Arvicola amphibius]|uniref:protein PBDC1 isoform X3 n=1 Tax=Arvicola amphibius TaxID=1047088 RepID=UPI0018E2FF2E|nr:protein PBDC1 isoform X3 [Arvicola amphibius]XP_038173337.1 protein PBDC1 isoform X3 [Arvicola amphibius]